MENNKRAIYADDLTSALRDDLNINGKNFARIKRHIDNAPTVDAVEVVHGRWEKASETMPIYRCSICKERNLFKNGNNVLSNFCPNCGADMKDNKFNLEDVFDLEAQTKANNDAMRKVISFMVDGAKMDGGNEDV